MPVRRRSGGESKENERAMSREWNESLSQRLEARSRIAEMNLLFLLASLAFATLTRSPRAPSQALSDAHQLLSSPSLLLKEIHRLPLTTHSLNTQPLTQPVSHSNRVTPAQIVVESLLEIEQMGQARFEGGELVRKSARDVGLASPVPPHETSIIPRSRSHPGLVNTTSFVAPYTDR